MKTSASHLLDADDAGLMSHALRLPASQICFDGKKEINTHMGWKKTRHQ